MTRPESPAQTCYDVARLMQQCESLGENCDLGVVQRAVGIEPFGLFRFSACDAPGVLALLRARLHPLGEPEDLWLDTVGPQQEYWVKSRRFPFESHTNRFAPQHERRMVRRGEIDRIRYLKSHLLQDLASGRKLFVFKGRSDAALIRELAGELERYGENCLLWVDVADRAHPPASLERASATLLRGYVSRFGTYEGSPSLPVEEWVSVCAQAFRLWRGEDPPRMPCNNLIARAMAAGSCHGSPAPAADTRAPQASSLPGEFTYDHRAASDPAVVGHVHLPIPEGGDFVFSAWIRIPEDSGIKRIGLLLTGYATVTHWPVDLKSRGRWQRAWVSATLPADARVIACELEACGAAGSTFQSARWCLERGMQPSGHGFAL